MRLVDVPEMIKIQELDNVLLDHGTDILNLTKLKLTLHFSSSSSQLRRQLVLSLHSNPAAMHIVSSQSYSSSLHAAK